MSKKTTFFTPLFILIIFFFWIGITNAQYVPLAPLPGVENASQTNLQNYLGAIFKIGIGLAGVFAVLMIVIGGIQFIGGASSPSARADAKSKITNAVFGLILALGSWLILNTINPAILNTSIDIKKTTLPTPSSSGGQYSGANTTSGSYGGQYESTLNTGEYCIDAKFSDSAQTVTTCGMTPTDCGKTQSLWSNQGFTIIKGCYPA